MHHGTPRRLGAGLALAAILGGGCFGESSDHPPPAPVKPAPGATAQAPDAPRPAGGPTGAMAGATGASSSEGEGSGQRNALQISTELDQSYQPAVYHAAMQLLDLVLTDSRALPEIAKRLKDGKVETQRTIVNAVGRYPKPGASLSKETFELVKRVLPLVTPFLGNPDVDLRREAVDAVSALDALDAADDSEPVSIYLETVLSQPKDQGATITERVSCIRVVARKPTKTAVRWLMTYFERTQVADVRDESRKQLNRLTGQSFRNVEEVKIWWEKNKDKSQDQWYQERIERMADEVKQSREVARDLWNRYRQTLADDQARYWAELEAAAKSSPISMIRIEAAKRLLESGKSDAYDIVAAMGREDNDVEVKKGAIDAIARTPPTDPQARARVIDVLLGLTDSIEKEIRGAAVAALGELKAERAVEALLRRIANPSRDADVATASLLAIAKIAPKAEERGAGKAVNDFLQREIARVAGDPLLEPRLVEQAAATLRAMQWQDGSQEGDRASKLLVVILEATTTLPPGDGAKPGDPKVTVPRYESRARVVAVISLAALHRPMALKSLVNAAADPDESVAGEAVRAVAPVATQKGVDPREKENAIGAIVGLLDSQRTQIKDAALEAIVEMYKADPSNLQLLSDAVDKLVKAQDQQRTVKLLKDMPAKLPADATAATRTLHQNLRQTLGNAYEALQPPDAKAALEIWQDLAKDDPEGIFADKYADALSALNSEKADDLWVDLIKRRPVEAATRYWPKRVGLARRIVDIATAATAKDVDKAKARALLDRVLADKASAPPALKADLEQLDRQLGKAPTTGQRPVPSTTLPGGLKRADDGRGDGS